MIPFNFVVDCEQETLKNLIDTVDTENPWQLVGKTDLEWSLQSYLILAKKTSLPLTCSNKLKRNAINIVHSDQLLKFKGEASHFIVCIQADFPKRSWAHYHLVQNEDQLAKDCSCIIFWLQPGLIKRDANRRGIQKVGYAGQPWANFAGTTESWNKLLNKHGIEFELLPKELWHDLRSIDVLIGIRSFDKNTHPRKPPSKLINAWHVQIPFIGGYDSAFSQVGEPGKDYLRVSTHSEAVEAILQLKSDPALFDSIVRNGSAKAQLYTNDTIAEKWEAVLTGPVQERYKEWKKNLLSEKLKFLVKLRFSIIEFEAKQVIKKMLGKNT